MTTAVQQGNAASPAQALYASLNGAQKAGSKELGPQDRFLKLLVTQLKNQDPLNPMDNAQMTSQMAQISTVEGIDKLNATLKMILEGSNESEAMQAAALVGHGVLVPGSGLALSAGMGIGGIELDGPADRVSVTIKDANGLAVRTLDLGALGAGSRAFSWDGKTDAGAPAADGAYTMAVAAQRGNDKVAARPLELGMVSSVVRTSDGASLNVGALGVFKMSDVRQIL
ncbi:MAG: flagellar hook assembly protein FlgD [Burkholderiales bacterium]|jgi:flagellar basal-body rod modification protein FlgD|uniref:Basal-body rod modification protein FlgD n=1 Tax=Candidatus Desulfobacillus denitrificans TaxID=2608985 RepID=A0A809SB89_9PROT|nr:flagellar hook assembly protein FlgD [Zoogloeaceae bacterium]MBP9655608.1 flagellar hook assembly protein FlgD [Rhodocyclaceae bacterium]MCZ2174352.1 flagellar hook assembly protein FlgD [Burkholderiales bacterium]OQY72029.1 MAG: flagellar biosynthesis protein FlgD [Rhodocyclaceae bacterium UTPRO2]BBO21424.1 flagellar biosynthesis protein FlgD [Candidatus Desulfobacillus denitrificans]GIK46215.1 MAG: basal-body rod modification protein FlgD [Betaproteobacteria bacterium]